MVYRPHLEDAAAFFVKKIAELSKMRNLARRMGRSRKMWLWISKGKDNAIYGVDLLG